MIQGGCPGGREDQDTSFSHCVGQVSHAGVPTSGGTGCLSPQTGLQSGFVAQVG